MTSEGLGEMFEGDSIDTCANFVLAHVKCCQAGGLACADPVARTPIGVSRNSVPHTCSADLLHKAVKVTDVVLWAVYSSRMETQIKCLI